MKVIYFGQHDNFKFMLRLFDTKTCLGNYIATSLCTYAQVYAIATSKIAVLLIKHSGVTTFTCYVSIIGGWKSM